MKSKVKLLIITFAPPVLVIIIFALKKYILLVADLMPPCRFHALTGLLCPGCGNTRAVREILSLHFLTALRYNVTIPLLLAAALALYLQYVISAWIKPVRIMPRNIWFYAVIGAMFVIYCVLRNFINFMP